MKNKSHVCCLNLAAQAHHTIIWPANCLFWPFLWSRDILAVVTLCTHYRFTAFLPYSLSPYVISGDKWLIKILISKHFWWLCFGFAGLFQENF